MQEAAVPAVLAAVLRSALDNMDLPAAAVVAAGPAVLLDGIIITAVTAVPPMFPPQCRTAHREQAAAQDTMAMAGATLSALVTDLVNTQKKGREGASFPAFPLLPVIFVPKISDIFIREPALILCGTHKEGGRRPSAYRRHADLQ